MKIAHIINPVAKGPDSDLYTAQPITFETMRRAQEYAADSLDNVTLYATHYPEDASVVPVGFEVLPNLERSVLDEATFQRPRKLPILKDILDRLYANSDADIFVYTNVDIALMPTFYASVQAMLQSHDALVINRRKISDHYSSVDEIPLMYAEAGGMHGGFDCFVFRREIYGRFELGKTCIGVKGIGVIVLANMYAFASDLSLRRDAHLTFHIGNDMPWTSSDLDDYAAYNYLHINQALIALRDKAGPLDETTPHGRFLLNRYHHARHHYLRDALALDNTPDELQPQRQQYTRRQKVKKFIRRVGRKLLSAV